MNGSDSGSPQKMSMEVIPLPGINVGASPLRILTSCFRKEPQESSPTTVVLANEKCVDVSFSSTSNGTCHALANASPGMQPHKKKEYEVPISIGCIIKKKPMELMPTSTGRRGGSVEASSQKSLRSCLKSAPRYSQEPLSSVRVSLNGKDSDFASFSSMSNGTSHAVMGFDGPASSLGFCLKEFDETKGQESNTKSLKYTASKDLMRSIPEPNEQNGNKVLSPYGETQNCKQLSQQEEAAQPMSPMKSQMRTTVVSPDSDLAVILNKRRPSGFFRRFLKSKTKYSQTKPISNKKERKTSIANMKTDTTQFSEPTLFKRSDSFSHSIRSLLPEESMGARGIVQPKIELGVAKGVAVLNETPIQPQNLAVVSSGGWLVTNPQELLEKVEVSEPKVGSSQKEPKIVEKASSPDLVRDDSSSYQNPFANVFPKKVYKEKYPTKDTAVSTSRNRKGLNLAFLLSHEDEEESEPNLIESDEDSLAAILDGNSDPGDTISVAKPTNGSDETGCGLTCDFDKTCGLSQFITEISAERGHRPPFSTNEESHVSKKKVAATIAPVKCDKSKKGASFGNEKKVNAHRGANKECNCQSCYLERTFLGDDDSSIASDDPDNTENHFTTQMDLWFSALDDVLCIDICVDENKNFWSVCHECCYDEDNRENGKKNRRCSFDLAMLEHSSSSKM